MKKVTPIFLIGLSWLLTLQGLVAQCVTAVDAISITVSDLEESVLFYTRVLGFEKVSEGESFGPADEQLHGLFGIRKQQARLRLGTEEIVLTDYLTVGGKPIPADSRSNDLWFQHIAIVVSDMEAAYAILRRHKVEHVSTGPQTLPKSLKEAAGIRAFYFQDPDGHVLELINFPPEKGNPKWQQETDQVFLGIDHTAIGIRQTARSAEFYRNVLGMTLGGESYNFGTEQEHLNNVAGASLHITGNKTLSGPGVEFLEYLKPEGGRPYPADARTDDLIAWATHFLTNDIESVYQKLKDHSIRFVSPAIVTLTNTATGYQRGFYVKDPDGHLVGIFEK